MDACRLTLAEPAQPTAAGALGSSPSALLRSARCHAWDSRRCAYFAGVNVVNVQARSQARRAVGRGGPVPTEGRRGEALEEGRFGGQQRPRGIASGKEARSSKPQQQGWAFGPGHWMRRNRASAVPVVTPYDSSINARDPIAGGRGPSRGRCVCKSAATPLGVA